MNNAFEKSNDLVRVGLRPEFETRMELGLGSG